MFWRRKKVREIEDIPDIEEVRKLEKRIEAAERLASAQGTQQRYIIKKEVRIGRRRTLMALPSEEEPRYFTSFPSIDDIRREFYEDFGGGSYHVYATTPREFRVHTYELGGEERSPFAEEEIEVRVKDSNPSPPPPPTPQSSEYEEIQQALMVSQQAGISFQEAWGFLREAKMRKREEEKESLEDALEKSAKNVLDQDPELKNEIVRSYLRSRFKEGDELSKLLQFEEVRRKLAGNNEGLLNPQILSYFLAFLPLLFAQPPAGQPLAGQPLTGQPLAGQPPQAMFPPYQTPLPTPQPSSSLTPPPWQQWEAMLQQQQSQQQQQRQQPQPQSQPQQQRQQWQQQQQQQTYIAALSNLVQMLAQREPEEVLTLLRTAKNNPYVRAFLIFLRKIDYDYNKLISYASMYGGEEIANTLREHEDWLRKFLDLLRKAVERRRAAKARAKLRARERTRQKEQVAEKDLDFSVGEVQIDLGIGEEKEEKEEEEEEEKKERRGRGESGNGGGEVS